MDSPFLQKLAFTTNGIRGIANVDLTPYTCTRIGQALGTFLGRGASIVIGTDYRVSGPIIKSALISGLLSTGVHVHDAGVTPTPALQKHVKEAGTYKAGLIVTASHNPPEFNGIKVIDHDGIEFPPAKERQVQAIYDAWTPAIDLPPWNGTGILSHVPDAVERYMNAVMEHARVDRARARDITIVVDPGNGVACTYVEAFLSKLGLRYSSIFGEADGCFPNRVSEPTPESLAPLSRAVVEQGASFGIGFDGDGDRAIFVDGEGTFHWGDESFAVILDDLLDTYKGWVVSPVSSSVLVQDVVEAHGAKLEWTRVGSITVSRRMLELDAIIAGEENGGIFYKPHQPVRDGGIALALIAGIVSRTGQDLATLCKRLPKYHLHKETTRVEQEDKARVMEHVREATASEQRLLLDGVKVFKDGGSVLIRASGTEPKFRSFADGKTRERAEALARWGISLVKEALDG